MQLTSNSKPSSIVGLEIEAGSIAATEVKANGSIAVTRTAIAPLDPGIVSEGEVQDAAALSSELKSFFAKNKLGKTVTPRRRQPARRGPHPAHAADRGREGARHRGSLPGPGPHPDAARPGRPGPPGRRDGERRRGRAPHGRRRRRGTPRHGQRPDRRASQGRPAARRDRPLRLRHDPRPDRRRSPSRSRAPCVPTILYCHLGDVTNLAVARGPSACSPASLPYGMENMADPRRRERADGERRGPRVAPRGRPRRPARGLRRRPRRGRERPRGPERGRLAPGRRASRLARVLRRPGGRAPDRRDRRLRARRA